MRRLLAFFQTLFVKLFETGEIIGRIDIDIASGLTRLAFLLRRGLKSDRYYVTLDWQGGESALSVSLKSDDLDRLIATCEEIRAAQSAAFASGPVEVPLLGRTTDMILRGKVLRQTDIKLGDGSRLSLRLKQQTNPTHQYIVVGIFAGLFAKDFAFEFGEFHRFAAAAKKMRAQMPDDYARSNPAHSEVA